MHNSEIDEQLEQIGHRLRSIERTLATMATRADFDAALLALGVAIDQAVIRVGAGGAFTDADIATLNADTVKVNQIGGTVSAGGLVFRPASVVGGQPVACSLNQSVSAGAGGEVYNCSSDNLNATAPAQVTVGAGAASVDFQVNTVPVSAKTLVTIFCTSPFHSFTGQFTITP